MKTILQNWKIGLGPLDRIRIEKCQVCGLEWEWEWDTNKRCPNGNDHSIWSRSMPKHKPGWIAIWDIEEV